MRIKFVAAALTLAVAAQAHAGPFAIDLTVLGLGTTAYTNDGKTGKITELQFAEKNNDVTVTFYGGTADFATGSTFTFTDTGEILGTAFLPPGFGTDYEGFGTTWTLNGSFALSGSGTVIGTDINGNPLLSFNFDPGGTFDLDYVDTDETVNVLTGFSRGGTGNVSAQPGSFVPSASAFVFDADTTTLYPGFWLVGGPGGVPFIPSLTIVKADGNINNTTTTVLGSRTYRIDNDTDGSASLDLKVPEPGSLALFGLALFGVRALRRKQVIAEA